MTVSRIAVIGGDGIGPEVIEQAIRVSDAALRKHGGRVDWNRLPWSGDWYKKTGMMMPPDGWEILKGHDAILLGAIGHPDVPDHITLHGLLLPMRRKFDQYLNLRPAYLYAGVPCPLCDHDPVTAWRRTSSVVNWCFQSFAAPTHAPLASGVSCPPMHATPTAVNPFEAHSIA